MSKYRNKKVTVLINKKEFVFDSRLEYKRYKQLILLFRAGMIRDLALHPTLFLTNGYKILKNGNKSRSIGIKYIADFYYVDKEGRAIIEDTKGALTPTYQIKKSLLLSGFFVKEKSDIKHFDLFVEVFKDKKIVYKLSK